MENIEILRNKKFYSRNFAKLKAVVKYLLFILYINMLDILKILNIFRTPSSTQSKIFTFAETEENFFDLIENI